MLQLAIVFISLEEGNCCRSTCCCKIISSLASIPGLNPWPQSLGSIPGLNPWAQSLASTFNHSFIYTTSDKNCGLHLDTCVCKLPIPLQFLQEQSCFFVWASFEVSHQNHCMDQLLDLVKRGCRMHSQTYQTH